MPSLPSDYSQFTVRDFVLDEGFRRWVLQPDEPTMSFWHAFMLQNPQQQPAIDEAASLLLHLKTNYDDLTDASYQRIWAILEQAYAGQSTPVIPFQPFIWQRLGSWKVAASVLVLLGTLVTGWHYRQSRQQRAEHTAFGETRIITLPDGSTVKLNGNSTLTYRADWSHDQPREVWLEGEGFFVVARQSVAGRRVKFTTHTPSLDVQVLGTQFNVNTRRGQTDVTLLEGKVTLLRPNDAKATVLEMKPGQVAVSRPGIEQVAVQQTDADVRTAWTQQQFVFEKTPLRQIAQQLADSHGLTLVFANEALADRQFTGNLSSQDLETLLTTLAATFDLTIERDSTTVYLRSQ